VPSKQPSHHAPATKAVEPEYVHIETPVAPDPVVQGSTLASRAAARKAEAKRIGVAENKKVHPANGLSTSQSGVVTATGGLITSQTVKGG
jgi:hypothetical protein